MFHSKVKKLGNFVLALAFVFVISGVVSFAAEKRLERPLYLGTSIRSLDNPYHADWNKGGRLFAEYIGMGKYYRCLLSEGNSEKQIDDIKALIAKAGKDVIFNIDPNQAPDCRPIAEICEKAGVYFVTQWNKPDDLHPWDYKYWVAHIAVDDVKMAYEYSKALFETFKGRKAKIVAIRGLLANTADINRFEGLKKALAEYPNVKLVATQTGEWIRTKAFNVMQNFLVAYPDIDGVYVADDNMAIGALEALRAAGLAGKVGVVGCAAIEEAVEAVMKGEMVATYAIDPMWQGGIGLSLAYHAYIGELDPTKLPKEKREWYFKGLLITKENAEEYYKTHIQSIPYYDWEDLWGRWVRGMTSED